MLGFEPIKNQVIISNTKQGHSTETMQENVGE